MEISVILIQKEKRKKGKAQGKAQDSKQKKKEKKRKRRKKTTPCRIRTPALSPSDLSFSAPHTFSSPEPLGFTHHYEWLWLQPKIRIFSLANETQCALGIKLQSTAHFRRVNVVVFKNQRVYKRTCFSFEHFERR